MSGRDGTHSTVIAYVCLAAAAGKSDGVMYVCM